MDDIVQSSYLVFHKNKQSSKDRIGWVYRKQAQEAEAWKWRVQK